MFELPRRGSAGAHAPTPGGAGRHRRAGRGARRAAPVVALLAVLGVVSSCVEPPAPADPTNFQLEKVFYGLNLPTAIRFADDGRAFVAERGGVIKTFDSITDKSATVVADLSSRVSLMWDRGMVGIAVDPAFNQGRRYIYALYSYDAPLGSTAPAWTDGCAFEGFGNNGVCGITSGQLLRIEVGPDNTSVGERVLIRDWCQQFGGHSVADVGFGPEGALYASAGEGAYFYGPDFGQFSGNPCGDPVNEGGMLRSQDARTTGDPTGLGGTIIRIDPDTGAAWPTNPWAGDPDPNRARILAYGFREPYRFTFDTTTNELLEAEVGWNLWDEVNQFHLDEAQPPNFGWPCYEGADRQPLVDELHLPLCDSLAPAQVRAPIWSDSHTGSLAPGCTSGGTSLTGIVVGRDSSYPEPFKNGLFVADYSRQCVLFFPRNANGTYNFDAPRTLVTRVGAVDLQTGPFGDIYFADIIDGSVSRLIATGDNEAPTAVIHADETSGALPLTVHLDGLGSSDPQSSSLQFSWDLDDDGDFDDGTTPEVSRTFTNAGNHQVRLRVADWQGAFDVAEVTISAGNHTPEPTIDLPAAGTYAPGTMIDYSGSATDIEDGTIPEASLEWTFTVQHCMTVTDCHEHEIGTVSGVDGGQFEMPDHPDPSYLDIRLSAVDSFGSAASTVRRLRIG